MLFIDQLNNTIELNSYPKRIISLVPSQSELLWDLGLRTEIIGITKFCIHPNEMFQTTERVGGTKTLNIDKIRSLKPDLIIGNKEENEKTQIEVLQKEFPVWMSDIYNLSDSLQMIQSIGELVDRIAEATFIKDNIQSSFKSLQTSSKSVLYLIWNNPYMAAGRATFIGNMLHEIGLQNILLEETVRYPELSITDIKKLNPDLIFLSSEPYPFKEEHIKDLKKQLPFFNVILVDGELFSWYGSRLQKSAAYFNKLILTCK